MHISLFQYRLFHFLYLQKNHVRDVKAFAIRGVLPAISIAASIDIGIFSIDALLSTIVVNSSAV
jgi:hypothetical protein